MVSMKLCNVTAMVCLSPVHGNRGDAVKPYHRCWRSNVLPPTGDRQADQNIELIDHEIRAARRSSVDALARCAAAIANSGGRMSIFAGELLTR
jgi:hypothetical protein